MAVSPGEIRGGDFTTKEFQVVALMEEKIDGFLMFSLSDRRGFHRVIINLSDFDISDDEQGLCDLIREELKRRYRRAGWKYVECNYGSNSKGKTMVFYFYPKMHI